MLRIKERLLRAWLAYKRLTGLSFPRRFPIVQFPNLPLIVAVLAGAAGKFLDGSADSYAASVSYLALTIWAYEELVHGVNWFRRLLGLAFVILLMIRVAPRWRPTPDPQVSEDQRRKLGAAMNGRAAACVLTIVTPEKCPGNMP